MEPLSESPAAKNAVETSAPGLRPDLLPDGQVDVARRLFQKSLAGMADALAVYLHAPVETRMAESRQTTLAEALGQGETLCLAALDLDPFQGEARLALGGRLAGAALEMLLGASEADAEVPRDALTDLDLHVLHGMIAVVAAELRRAWEPVSGSSFALKSVTSADPSALGAEDGSVLVLSAEATAGGREGSLRLMVPSLFVRLAAEPQPAAWAGREPGEALMEALGGASLRVEAALSGARIRLRDLLDLRPGHTVELPRKADALVECQVNGVVKFRGEMVSRGQSVAFQVSAVEEGRRPGDLVTSDRPGASAE